MCKNVLVKAKTLAVMLSDKSNQVKKRVEQISTGSILKDEYWASLLKHQHCPIWCPLAASSNVTPPVAECSLLLNPSVTTFDQVSSE